MIVRIPLLWPMVSKCSEMKLEGYLPLRTVPTFVNIDSTSHKTTLGLGRSLVCDIVLPNKKNQNKKSAKQQKQKKQQSSQPKIEGSLGRSLLKAGLGGLGGLLGPAGASVGGMVGDWGANLLGLGDYKVEENSLLAGNGVPNMHMGSRGMRVKHREFLGDITGSTNFVNRSYTIQPGSQLTFPWLSRMSELFQSYRIHGLVFTFNSTSADALNSVNTALGTVIMSTQYNVALPPFTSKAEMEQYEYTVAGRPSRNLVHTVECDPSLQVMEHLFTRSGFLPAGQDYQFYDWGVFSLATVGMQAAATIGELWVSYDIEFYKPRIQGGGSWPGDFTRISNGPYNASNEVLGTLQTVPQGNLGITIERVGGFWRRIQFPEAIANGRFLIRVRWAGATSAAITYPTVTFSNLTQSSFYFGGTSAIDAPLTSNVANAAAFETVVTVNGYQSGGSFIDFGAAGTLPAAPSSVNILVVALPLADAPI